MALECKIREDAIKRIIEQKLNSDSSYATMKTDITDLKTKVQKNTTDITDIKNKVPLSASLIYSSNSITCSSSEPGSLPNGHIHLKY